MNRGREDPPADLCRLCDLDAIVQDLWTKEGKEDESKLVGKAFEQCQSTVVWQPEALYVDSAASDVDGEL